MKLKITDKGITLNDSPRYAEIVVVKTNYTSYVAGVQYTQVSGGCATLYKNDDTNPEIYNSIDNFCFFNMDCGSPIRTLTNIIDGKIFDGKNKNEEIVDIQSYSLKKSL